MDTTSNGDASNMNGNTNPTKTNSDDDDVGNYPSMNATISDSSSDVIPSTPPSKHEQLCSLKNSMLVPLRFPSKVYLVPKKWYDTFDLWARGPGQEPGRVDPAKVLLDADGVLREDVIEERDWLITNEEGWFMIKLWYSFAKRDVFNL
jgi:hypothetical protein